MVTLFFVNADEATATKPTVYQKKPIVKKMDAKERQYQAELKTINDMYYRIVKSFEDLIFKYEEKWAMASNEKIADVYMASLVRYRGYILRYEKRWNEAVAVLDKRYNHK